MQQSLEEILRSRMAQPVSIKGKEGATVMPMEAIAMAIMNNAMRGDLAAANSPAPPATHSTTRRRPGKGSSPWSPSCARLSRPTGATTSAL